MSKIIIKLNEGGALFMYPMAIMFFVILGFLIYAIIKKDNYDKTIEYLKSFGWLTAAWGLLGHSIGLITGFDAVSTAQDISPEILAEGLKIALLTPLAGAMVFIAARISIIILLILRKQD